MTESRENCPRLADIDLEPALRKTVANRLSWAMGRAGVTQVELSRMSGVPKAVINRVLCRRRLINVDALVRVCLVLGVDATWLLGLRPAGAHPRQKNAAQAADERKE